MNHQPMAPGRQPVAQIGPAAVLGIALLAGLSLFLGHGVRVGLLLIVAAVALVGGGIMVWQFRRVRHRHQVLAEARFARRWRAALDAFAEQQIARDNRRKASTTSRPMLPR